MTLSTGMQCPPPPPSRPSSLRELEIRGTTLLMVGARGRLTAWEPTNGQMREVWAAWSAEGDAISMTTDGLVTARHLGQSAVRASAGGLTGAAIVQVVPSVAGAWHGSITVLDCWQTVRSQPDPCERRRGLTAPLVLDVTQSAAAGHADNLRAVVEIFSPPARGNFIGAVEASGHFFLEGNVERATDSLGGFVRFRWLLQDQRLVPFALSSPPYDDRIDLALSVKLGSAAVAFNEIWRVSSMAR